MIKNSHQNCEACKPLDDLYRYKQKNSKLEEILLVCGDGTGRKNLS